MALDEKIYTKMFIKIGSGVQKLLEVHTQTESTDTQKTK
jgi:hypothetical protein